MPVNASEMPSSCVCPLCGQSNACVMAAGAAPDTLCWCRAAAFPPALLDQVPPAARRRACICQDCVQQHAEV